MGVAMIQQFLVRVGLPTRAQEHRVQSQHSCGDDSSESDWLPSVNRRGHSNRAHRAMVR
jgi:hypothetical protein